MKPISCLTLLVLAACSGSDSPTEIRDSIAGTYTISAVNGDAVPVHVEVTSPALDVLGGTVAFRGDGTVDLSIDLVYYWRKDGVWVREDGPPRSSSAAGKWTMVGSAISIIQTEPAGGNFLNWNGERGGRDVVLTRATTNEAAGRAGISTLTLSR